MTSYLDHAATTPMRPEARAAWLEVSERTGNPSSLHSSGRASRALLEDARERIAAALGAHPTEVILTSGATEANNLALKGAVEAGAAGVIASAVEHHAVLDSMRWLGRRGVANIEVPVDSNALIDLDYLSRALAVLPGATLSLQAVNNETGAIQPLALAVELAQRHGAPVHSDAVQAVGHLAFHFASSGLTTAAVSAHKLGGPVGIGLLLARRDAALAMQQHGGGQERRLRSGTVDVAGACAFASALEAAVTSRSAEAARLAALGQQLADAMGSMAPDAVVHGPATGAPHIVHAIIPGAPSELLLVALDAAGVDASPGAACTAGVIESSHVVMAMGYSALEALCTVRLSLGWSSSQEDVAAAIAALPDAITAARAAGALR